MSRFSASAAKRWAQDMSAKAQRAPAATAADAVKGGASAAARAAKGAHHVVQDRLFKREAPTLYRLKGDKYSHCYGSPQRESQGTQSMEHLAPYITTGIMMSLGLFFVVFPLMFNQNYENTKKKYESFYREHEDQLNAQYDRGQFNRDASRR